MGKNSRINRKRYKKVKEAIVSDAKNKGEEKDVVVIHLKSDGKQEYPVQENIITNQGPQNFASIAENFRKILNKYYLSIEGGESSKTFQEEINSSSDALNEAYKCWKIIEFNLSKDFSKDCRDALKDVLSKSNSTISMLEGKNEIGLDFFDDIFSNIINHYNLQIVSCAALDSVFLEGSEDFYLNDIKALYHLSKMPEYTAIFGVVSVFFKNCSSSIDHWKAFADKLDNHQIKEDEIEDYELLNDRFSQNLSMYNFFREYASKDGRGKIDTSSLPANYSNYIKKTDFEKVERISNAFLHAFKDDFQIISKMERDRCQLNYILANFYMTSSIYLNYKKHKGSINQEEKNKLEFIDYNNARVSYYFDALRYDNGMILSPYKKRECYSMLLRDGDDQDREFLEEYKADFDSYLPEEGLKLAGSVVNLQRDFAAAKFDDVIRGSKDITDKAKQYPFLYYEEALMAYELRFVSENLCLNRLKISDMPKLNQVINSNKESRKEVFEMLDIYGGVCNTPFFSTKLLSAAASYIFNNLDMRNVPKPVKNGNVTFFKPNIILAKNPYENSYDRCKAMKQIINICENKRMPSLKIMTANAVSNNSLPYSIFSMDQLKGWVFRLEKESNDYNKKQKKTRENRKKRAALKQRKYMKKCEGFFTSLAREEEKINEGLMEEMREEQARLEEKNLKMWNDWKKNKDFSTCKENLAEEDPSAGSIIEEVRHSKLEKMFFQSCDLLKEKKYDLAIDSFVRCFESENKEDPSNIKIKAGLSVIECIHIVGSKILSKIIKNPDAQKLSQALDYYIKSDKIAARTRDMLNELVGDSLEFKNLNKNFQFVFDVTKEARVKSEKSYYRKVKRLHDEREAVKRILKERGEWYRNKSPDEKSEEAKLYDKNILCAAHLINHNNKQAVRKALHNIDIELLSLKVRELEAAAPKTRIQISDIVERVLTVNSKSVQ